MLKGEYGARCRYVRVYPHRAANQKRTAHALLDFGDATGGWEALELEGIVAGDDAFFSAGELHHAFLRLDVGRAIGLGKRGARGMRIEIAVKIAVVGREDIGWSSRDSNVLRRVGVARAGIDADAW